MQQVESKPQSIWQAIDEFSGSNWRRPDDPLYVRAVNLLEESEGVMLDAQRAVAKKTIEDFASAFNEAEKRVRTATSRLFAAEKYLEMHRSNLIAALEMCSKVLEKKSA